MALILIDLDHFKQVNDRYGHLVGDRALQHVASVLSSGVRGVALAPDHAADAHTMYLQVDRALYAAKRSGRDQCLSA